MRLLSLSILIALALSAVGVISLQATPNFKVEASFIASPTGWASSAPLLLASDGNYYGTAARGGLSDLGTIFRMAPDGTLTTLVSFKGSNGRSPQAALIQGKDGNLYGTTSSGGRYLPTYDAGTIFKVTLDGTLTTLFTFDWVHGTSPNSLLQGGDGNFYGTTLYGGDYDQGIVFRLTPAGEFTILHSFNGTDGRSPGSLIQDAKGNLYGVTYEGSHGYTGDSQHLGDGTVFRITRSGVFKTLVTFNGHTSGLHANGLILANDGNFYGTTFGQYSYGGGTLFRMSPAGSLAVLASFASEDGLSPNPGLIQASDGNLYGTTTGNVTGTVFRATLQGTFSTLCSIPAADSQAGVIQGSDGDLYGTTSSGLNNDGGIYKVSPDGIYTTVAAFAADLAAPYGMILGQDGTFYGVASKSSPRFSGGIFRYQPNGQLTTFARIPGLDDTVVYLGTTSVIQATDGNFYGTTYHGGNDNKGMIYKVGSAGTVSTLVSFSGTNTSCYPSAGLLQARDGNLYGAAFGFFKLSLAGVLTSFAPGSTYSPLIETRVGNFCGVDGSGTAFKLTPKGAVTVLASDIAPTSANSYSDLLQASDGNFYGTAYRGGASGNSVFKITSSREATYLGHFTGANGSGPRGALIQASDGNFYGTMTEGGVYQFGPAPQGTVFRLTPKGEVTPMVTFTGMNGATPSAALVAGPDGRIYGTTTAGGAYGAGTIFSFGLVAPNAQTIAFPAIPSQIVGKPFSVLVTASSGLPIALQVNGPATVESTLSVPNDYFVTPTGAGKVTIIASQAGSSEYAAAPKVKQSFVVNGETPQTITFPAIGNQVVGDSITLNATASSGLPVTYKTAGPAKVVGNTLTITGVGTVAVGAYQAGNAQYAAAPDARLKFKASLPVP